MLSRLSLEHLPVTPREGLVAASAGTNARAAAQLLQVTALILQNCPFTAQRHLSKASLRYLEGTVAVGLRVSLPTNDYASRG